MAKDITLVIVTDHCYELAKFSIEQTLKHIDCQEVITFSDQEIISGATYIPLKEPLDMQKYCNLVLKDLSEYVKTNHIIIVQWDGMAADSTQWTDDFLQYDYIGSPWGDGQVGNGGFSLRSKKLLDACNDTNIKLGGTSGYLEDVAICKEFKPLLVNKYNIQFPPLSLAQKFSVENDHVGLTFGFHGIWNAVRYFDPDTLRFIQNSWPDYINSSSKKGSWNSMLQQRGITL